VGVPARGGQAQDLTAVAQADAAGVVTWVTPLGFGVLGATSSG
jgi:hypothetical protein